jgi:hypothetical protein
MPCFRKKPVVIEAVKWDGTATGATPIIDWILATGQRSARFHEHRPEIKVSNGEIAQALDPAHLSIDTLEGRMRADIGDWIIRGVQGEHYPCKPDIFDATYEPVDE